MRPGSTLTNLRCIIADIPSASIRLDSLALPILVSQRLVYDCIDTSTLVVARTRALVSKPRFCAATRRDEKVCLAVLLDF